MIVTKFVIFRGKQKLVSDLSKNSSFKVEVLCSICNKTRIVTYRSVCSAGHTDCIRCVNSINFRRDLVIGDKYGLVTILNKTDKTGFSLGVCDCGVIKVFSNERLVSGMTKSCGCLRGKNKPPEILKGKFHPNWKGGISPERNIFMQSNEYKN